MSTGKSAARAQRHLLDVNVLLAAIWSSHPEHARAQAWLTGKKVLLCPVAELGFLRVSTNRKALGVSMEQARRLLEEFTADSNAHRIPDDLPALASHPRKSEEVTDQYLADLAVRHGARLATFDAGIVHTAVDLIA